jgi:hypothetical protein
MRWKQLQWYSLIEYCTLVWWEMCERVQTSVDVNFQWNGPYPHNKSCWAIILICFKHIHSLFLFLWSFDAKPVRRTLCNRVGSVGWAGSGQIIQCKAILTSVAKWPYKLDRGLASSLSYLSTVLSHAVYTFLTPFFYHVFCVLWITYFLWLNSKIWQYYSALNCWGQRHLVSLPSSNWGLWLMATPNPYCDWLLYLPMDVKLHKNMKWIIVVLKLVWYNPLES